MEPFIASIYLSELKDQCQIAIQSYNQFVKSINNENINAAEAFFHLENFVLRAGGASKLLWPQKDRRSIQGRGKHLRHILVLSSDHVISDRALRNHIEHWDERIDRWQMEDNKKIFLDQFIGPVNGFVIVDGASAIALRHFDPTTWTAYFAGEAFKVQDIADGCADLLKRLDALARKGDWNFQHLAL